MRASTPRRSASPCGSSTPAAWSRSPPTSPSRPGAVLAAHRGAGRRRADPVRCRMVADGVTRARLPRDNEVICTLDDAERPGARRAARHHAHGRGDGAVARPARRRGRRDRQRADRVVPPAGNARRRRAAARLRHRHAGRLRRRGGIEGGADRERPRAGARGARPQGRQRDGGGRGQRAGERSSE